jgi:cytochrome P450
VGLSDTRIQDDPFAYYAERREQCPVWHEPDIDLYVIGGYADARAALLDVERFSSRPVRKGAAGDPAAVAYLQVLSERGWSRASTLQRTDPPAHTHYRSLLNRVFTPARVRELAPHIDSITDELIDRFIDRGSCEFVGEFALALPGILIAEQLGLDRSEYETFRRWADAMLALANRKMTVDEAIAEAEIEVQAQHFLATEFERRRGKPTGDLISALVHAHGDDAEPLTMHELQDLMHQLITGGFETTTAALSSAMLLLATRHDQQQLLREQPELMKNFIDEVLRFDSPVQGLWRRATCPIDVHGVSIPADAAVMVRYGSANRDPAAFEQPDDFDITRADAKNHIAFGLGPHYCVGAALARQQMASAFTAIMRRLDDIELDGPMPTPRHHPSFFLRPMTELRIRFQPIS